MKFTPPSRASSTLGIAMILLVALVTTTLPGQQTATQRGNIAKLVCQMIEANHISQQPIDDRVASRLVDQFIKDLDPQKMYFLQSDIARFNKYRTELDEQLKAGNLDFAYEVFSLFLKRLDERIAKAREFIDAPHDFTVNETMEIDAKDMPWAADVASLDERWRKRIKYDLLLFRLDKDKTSEAEARKRLDKRYKTIRDTMHKTDDDEIFEMYLTALCTSFDPHSSYMAPRTLEDFRIQMELSLEGIGAALRTEEGYTIVAQIVPGGAAALDGRLKPGDKIIEVSNDKGEMTDVVEMKLTKVVDLIRGKSGTIVKLKVIPASGAERVVYELTRQKVELKSAEVKGEILRTNDRLKTEDNLRLGIVHIPSFYRDFRGAENGDNDFKSTSRDVRKVLRDFAAHGGVDCVVVDLRKNGGGALTEAIEVSGLFVDKGPVVQVKNQKGRIKVLEDEETGVDYQGPLVVLTDRLSASASEIFAGVIKDYGRGLIVGDQTTHGKGTVQSVMNVGRQILPLLNPPDQGALKLTINQFYRVNGDSTQNEGVKSDIALPSLLDNYDLGEASLDNAMAFDQIAPARHTQFGQVKPEFVSELRELSRKRVAGNADFQKTDREIARYLARKKRKNVSLNEEELRRERYEEDQKNKEKIDTPDEFAEGPIFPDNSYNNELLNIANDYVHLLREARTAKK